MITYPFLTSNHGANDNRDGLRGHAKRSCIVHLHYVIMGCVDITQDYHGMEVS